MRARSAARNRMSLMTAGQASASTQICMNDSAPRLRGGHASAAGSLLFPLSGALLFERLRRLLLGLFLAIHTFAHDVSPQCRWFGWPQRYAKITRIRMGRRAPP